MNFIERIIGLFTSPDKTMADIAKEPRIEEALVLVAILAIFGAISGYVYYLHTPMTYEMDTGTDMSGLMSTVTLITSIVGGIVWPFIAWVIVTVLLYLIAMAFGGAGKFTTVLTAIGYTTVPKILATIISLLLLAIAPVAHVTVTSSGRVSGLTDLTNSLPMQAAGLIGIVLVIWSCYMGVYAIKHTEKLSLKSAAIVVGIPLAAYLLLIIVSRVIGMSMGF